MLKGLVTPTKRQPRVVLYGPPGAGKTTFGSEADYPVFICTESGADNLNVPQFAKATTWAEIVTNVKEVASGEHSYKTLVIDTLNGAAQLCADAVCKEQFGGNFISKKGVDGFNSWGAGWNATAERMRELIVILDEVREKRGMMIILLSHTGIQSVKNPLGSDYTKHQPDVPKQVWSLFHAWSDVILRADYDYAVVGQKGAKGKAQGTSVRILYAAGDAGQDAKTRVGYELPERLGLSFAEFKAALGKGDSVAAEIAQLWPVLDKDGAKKALAYLGISDIKDIGNADMTKARATLNRLRQLDAATANQEESK